MVKNTEWVVGIVVCTGSDTKIILNSQKGAMKQSHLEGTVNKLIMLILAIQISLCIICAILNFIWATTYGEIHSYLHITDSSLISGVLAFWSYLLLLNTMIPISLIVTVEIVKYCQGYFINKDIKMYCHEKEKYIIYLYPLLF